MSTQFTGNGPYPAFEDLDELYFLDSTDLWYLSENEDYTLEQREELRQLAWEEYNNEVIIAMGR